MKKLKEHKVSKYLFFGYGGISSAVIDNILNNNQNDKVTVVTRKNEIQNNNVEIITFDQLDNYLENNGLPDYIINTIGALHDEKNMPEKSIPQISKEWLHQSIDINTMPTVLIAQAIHKYIKKDSNLKFMIISARVSSIKENELGGWYSYRMSKAALNMLIKTISIEWSRQFKNAIIFGYHPGTVDTFLSEPFKKNIDPSHLFSPQEAAKYLLTNFHNIKQEQSGLLIDWEGKLIDF